ncbi:hypothetical protein TUM19329_07510 [Legionella antarctica]|uniref:Uncharacterized protein n=1 Tax=Legionella antarctica TaxID=2708020 RepID=A0A6F8T2K6_9GAMM|nr:hypothetical protein [Legionella antarctica]BCA94390.1 hypothetical protein TUM19329_07510 [Legionella antarctica]
MKINFRFTSDVFSHWGLIPYLRLEAIEFILDNSHPDQITEKILLERFSIAEEEPVTYLVDSQTKHQFKKIVMDGAGYRLDFLEKVQIKKIIRQLSLNKMLTINDAQTGEADSEANVLKNYIIGLSAVLKEYEQKYTPKYLLEKLSTDWLKGSNFARDMSKIPSGEEVTLIHKLLIKDIEELQRVLEQLEADYPHADSDIISLEQGYSASFDVNLLGINLFKAATVACIKELTLCAEKLTPAYYSKKIQQYELNFADLLTCIPGHDEENRAFIQTIYSKFAPEHTQLTEIEELKSIYANFNRISEILTVLSEYDLLNDANFEALERILQLPAEDAHKKLILLRKQISSLEQLSLLMQETLIPLLATDSFIDKSCPARTSVTGYMFFGSASQDEESYKRMWSIFCIGVENRLVTMLKENKSLAELLKFAAETRQTIASLRKESAIFRNFGGDRIRKSNIDTYANDNKSVINTSLFPFVSKIICREYDYSALTGVADLEQSQDIFEVKQIHKLSLKLNDGDEIELPDEVMTTTFKRSKNSTLKPTKVAVQFSILNRNDYEKMLQFFDNHFLEKCRNKEYNNEEFVTELGNLIFYLVRSYPFIRGTGAILQWEARSMVSYYTDGKVNLGDIRLGGNSDNAKNLPYDVYAHLVQSPDAYAEAFKNAVLPALTAQSEPNHQAVSAHSSIGT